MISDLIGRITEPVIRKRIIEGGDDDDREGDRQVADEAALEVDEVGGGAADQRGRARRRLAWRGSASPSSWLASELKGLAEIA